MAVPDPLGWLSRSATKLGFVVLFALAAILMAVWTATNAPLLTTAAPKGVLSFELAGTPESARSILASWDHNAQVNAGVNLGLDYLFLIAYNGTIAFACVLLARRFFAVGWLSALGFLLAWAQAAGALADSTENYALIQQLRGSIDSGLPSLARNAAMIKGVISGAGIAFAVAGTALVVLAKIFPAIDGWISGRCDVVRPDASAKVR